MRFGIVWKAIFNDGTELNQFEDSEQTQENLFKKVLERQNELVKFCLFNVYTRKQYSVDLQMGAISTDGMERFEIDHIHETSNRIIYFRRIEKEGTINEVMGMKNGGSLKSLTYFLGFQWTDERGNHKRVVQIFEDDRIIIY